MLPPFGLTAVVTQWQAAPVVSTTIAVAAALYIWGVIRVRRRHPARPWPAWRTAMFLGGLFVVLVALQSGIGSYDDVLFWDHMIQHLLLVMVAPPLLIVGRPVTLLLHASRNPLHGWAIRVLRSPVVSFITAPVVGFAAYAGAIVIGHLTGVANLVLTNQVAHDAEHVVFLLVGYLFLLPILGSEPIRWRLSYPTRLILLFLIMPVDTFTGLVLTYGNRNTPGVLPGPRPAWAGTVVGDLHAGGAMMWIGGDALMFLLMMVIFVMWSTDTRLASRSHGWLESVRRATVTPGVAPAGVDIDEDDAQLAAYNAYLSRLSDGSHDQPDSAAHPG